MVESRAFRALHGLFLSGCSVLWNVSQPPSMQKAMAFGLMTRCSGSSFGIWSFTRVSGRQSHMTKQKCSFACLE